MITKTAAAASTPSSLLIVCQVSLGMVLAPSHNTRPLPLISLAGISRRESCSLSFCCKAAHVNLPVTIILYLSLLLEKWTAESLIIKRKENNEMLRVIVRDQRRFLIPLLRFFFLSLTFSVRFSFFLPHHFTIHHYNFLHLFHLCFFTFPLRPNLQRGTGDILSPYSWALQTLLRDRLNVSLSPGQFPLLTVLPPFLLLPSPCHTSSSLGFEFFSFLMEMKAPGKELCCLTCLCWALRVCFGVSRSLYKTKS